MFTESLSRWFSKAIFLTVVAGLAFLGFQYFAINVGTATVWIGAVASYWVVSALFLLPWSLNFEAAKSCEEIRVTKDSGGTVDPKDEEYANKTFRRTLITAITLHVVIAVAFFIVGDLINLGLVGYFAGFAALAVAAIRPLARYIDYATERLRGINQKVKFPREDVKKLQDRVNTLVGYDETAKEINETNKKLAKENSEINDAFSKIKEEFAAYKKKMDADNKAILHLLDEKISSISEATNVVDAINKIRKNGGSATFYPETPADKEKNKNQS